MLHRLDVVERQQRIDRRHDLTRRRHDRRRILVCRADDDGHRVERGLVQRPVELVRRVAREAGRSHVAQHADHLVPFRRVAPLSEPLGLPVVRIERAPGEQPDAHRLQVIAVDPAVLDQRRVVRAPRRAALDLHLAVHAEVEHRQMARHADALDAARVRQAVVQLAIERDLLILLFVTGTGERGVEGDDPFDADARVAIAQQDEILDEQARADQQRERRRDFGDDERVAETAARDAAGPQIAFAHGGGELRHPQARERPQSAEEAGRGGDAGREPQDARVDGDRRRARQLRAGEDDEGAHDPDGKQNAEGTARERQQQALDRHLAREIGGGGAERDANGHFAAACESGREQQVGHVRARDEEHAQHRAEEHAQRRPDASDRRLEQRLHVDAVIVLELTRECLAERAHLGGRALERHARLQPRVGDEKVTAARRRIELALQRHEHLGPAMREAVGHDADDLVRDAVQRHRPSDDRAIGSKLLLPQVCGEHGHPRTAITIFVLRVPPPQLRPDAERVAERRGRHGGAQTDRIARAREHVRPSHRSADRGKDLIALLPVVILRERRGARRAGGLHVVHSHESIRFGIRQRSEEDAAEDAEDGGRHADAERKRDDRERRDERRSDHRSDCDLQIEHHA